MVDCRDNEIWFVLNFLLFSLMADSQVYNCTVLAHTAGHVHVDAEVDGVENFISFPHYSLCHSREYFLLLFF